MTHHHQMCNNRRMHLFVVAWEWTHAFVFQQIQTEVWGRMRSMEIWCCWWPAFCSQFSYIDSIWAFGGEFNTLWSNPWNWHLINGSIRILCHRQTPSKRRPHETGYSMTLMRSNVKTRHSVIQGNIRTEMVIKWSTTRVQTIHQNVALWWHWEQNQWTLE